jgi:tripartite-type tricarboxylate transporter receptor subunit TctC
MTVSGSGIIRLALICLLCQFSAASWAQNYPAKPIRIVVGPGPDIIARIFGQKFTEAWGKQVIVDPRPAGGGTIAAEAVAKSAPDGYSLLLASASYPINTALQFGSYDLEKDFSAVVLCATAPFILIVHPSVPARSVRELVALAKSKPGQINYASSGNGTPPHLAGEMFKSMAGINIVHVPYKGAGQAMIDVIGGQVQMMFAIASTTLGQIQTGKVRALAVTSPQRSRLVPDLPTLAESDLPGYNVMGWNGLVAPTGTPRPVIAKLNAEALRALKQSDVLTRLTDSGYDPAGDNTPEQFADFIKREIAKWTKLVKESGAKVD